MRTREQVNTWLAGMGPVRLACMAVAAVVAWTLLIWGFAQEKIEVQAFVTELESVSVAWGTAPEDIPLPETLLAHVLPEEEPDGEVGEAPDLQEAEVPVIWTCEDYDSQQAGAYIFTAQAAEEYYYDGEDHPQVTVTVEEGAPEEPGQDSPVMEPMAAPVEDFTINVGGTVADGTGYTVTARYTVVSGVQVATGHTITFDTGANGYTYRLTGTSNEEYCIIVSAGVAVNLVFDHLNLTFSSASERALSYLRSTSDCPIVIEDGAAVNVYLVGTNSVQNNADPTTTYPLLVGGGAGIALRGSAALVIDNGEDNGGVGSLTVGGRNNGAGIGSGSEEAMNGSITVQGGEVEVNSVSGAGIGGGYLGDVNGTITINGSAKVSVSTTSGTGIGACGARVLRGTIAIGGDASVQASSGTVTGIGAALNMTGKVLIGDSAYVEATGALYGAGIGMGGTGRGGTMEGAEITISGGTVIANGGSGSSGQGGSGIGVCGPGVTMKDSTIHITGTADVTATGGVASAGIGAGAEAGSMPVEYAMDSGCAIIIDGGTVRATGGGESQYADGGAGIGGNGSGTVMAVRIVIEGGAKVTAIGGDKSPGIGVGGGGTLTSDGSIAIRGNAEVTATGGENGPGIGSGQDSILAGRIELQGGTVTANGGAGGAAIGSGVGGSIEGAITVTGGDVTAKNTYTSDGGAAIGSGSGSTMNGKITIAGSGQLELQQATKAAVIGSGSGGAVGPDGEITISRDLTLEIQSQGAVVGSGAGGDMDGAILLNNDAQITLTNIQPDVNNVNQGGAALGSGKSGNMAGSITVSAKLTGEVAGGSVLGGGAVIGTGGGGSMDGTIRITAEADVALTNMGDANHGGAIMGSGNNGSLSGVISIEGGKLELSTRAVNGALIGTGRYGELSGSIQIAGGTIDVIRDYQQGSSVPFAAAIGSGGEADLSGSIQISGGVITESRAGDYDSYVYGPGIGCGSRAQGDGFTGKIEISDGEINMPTLGLGAGIGTGRYTALNGDIEISGGQLKVKVGYQAAAIGTGGQGDFVSGQITLSGGTIEIDGSGAAAGLGTGIMGNLSGSILVTGGDITITMSGNGAAIGTGMSGMLDGGRIEIRNDVTATSTLGAAAIGTGYNGEFRSGEILVTNGQVLAESSDKSNAASGIGTGSRGQMSGGRIVISGGNVTAISASGAGIGTSAAFNGEISITGGTVTATGMATGIGGTGTDGSVALSATAQVVAYASTGYAIEAAEITGAGQFVNARFTDSTAGPRGIKLTDTDGNPVPAVVSAVLPDDYKSFAFSLKGETSPVELLLTTEITGEDKPIVNGDALHLELSPNLNKYGPYEETFQTVIITSASGDATGGGADNGAKLKWPVMIEVPSSADVLVYYYYFNDNGMPVLFNFPSEDNPQEYIDEYSLGDSFTIDMTPLRDETSGYMEWYYTLDTDGHTEKYYIEDVGKSFTLEARETEVYLYAAYTILDIGISANGFFWYANADTVIDIAIDPDYGSYEVTSANYYIENHSTHPLEVSLLDYEPNGRQEIEDYLTTENGEIVLNLTGDLGADGLGQDLFGDSTDFGGTYDSLLEVGEKWSYSFGGMFSPDIPLKLPDTEKTSDYLLSLGFRLYLGAPK